MKNITYKSEKKKKSNRVIKIVNSKYRCD